MERLSCYMRAMQRKAFSFWFGYTLLAVLILLRLIPLAAGYKPLWGVAQLIFLPTSFTIAYCILTAIALLLPLLPVSARLGESLACGFSVKLYESRSGTILHTVFVILLGVLFWAFSAPTHFLGDGYPYIANLGSTTGNWVKWTEGGAMQAVLALQALMGKTSLETAELAFRILSVGSGVVTIWFFFLIARVVSDNPVKRLLTFVTLALSPTLLLFFGYVESYPLLWGPIAGFLYFGLSFVNTGRGAVGAAVCLALATVAHLQALLFYPAFMYLLVSRGRGRELVRKFKLPFFLLMGLAIIVFGVLFYRKYTGDLYFQNLFLWAFEGKPVAPDYAILSLSHFRDIANELLLVAPLLPALFILAFGGYRKINRAKPASFLAILSAGALLFLLVFDPSITMPRDWDLFAICGLPVSLLVIVLIPKRNTGLISPLLVSFALAALLFTAPSLLVNLDRDRSINQFKAIIDASPEKSMGSMAILGTYYWNEGDRARSDSCETRMQQTYPRLYQMRKARQAIADDHIRDAQQYFRMIKPDIFWKDYHLFLAEWYMTTNRLDSALVHAEAAVQLQRYYQPGYLTLGLVHMARNELSKGLEALRFGLSLDNRSPLLLLNLAVVFTWQNQQDSLFFYAKRLYEIDTTSVLGRCLLARGYYFSEDRSKALLHGRRFLEMGGRSEEYKNVTDELLRLMPELRGS